jgi:hypothetical protein
MEDNGYHQANIAPEAASRRGRGRLPAGSAIMIVAFSITRWVIAPRSSVMRAARSTFVNNL